MFLPRSVALFAVLLATTSAATTNKPLHESDTTVSKDDSIADSWFTFPDFNKLFTPMWKIPSMPSFPNISSIPIFPNISSILNIPDFNINPPNISNTEILNKDKYVGPKIFQDDDKFQVVTRVGNYEKKDLKVKVKEEMIIVEGESNQGSMSSQFISTYTLPENASAANATAELTKDKFLVVNVPLHGSVGPRDKEISVVIKETGKPYKKPKNRGVRKSTTTPPKRKTTTPKSAEADGFPHRANISFHLELN